MNGQTPALPLPFSASIKARLARIDKVAWAVLAIYAGLLLLAPERIPESLKFVAGALIRISPFLLFSIAVAAYAQGTGSDRLIKDVFSGNPLATITTAALFGSLSPFCSCGVIPIVAGLLGAGVPLAPVMAFWISSPLMDPEMFILFAATLGIHFTVAKTLAALGLGLIGGFGTLAAQRLGLFKNPLSAASKSFAARPVPPRPRRMAAAFSGRSGGNRSGASASPRASARPAGSWANG